MKYFKSKNRLTYLIIILLAAFFIQTGAGDASFPAVSDAQNANRPGMDIHENHHRIYNVEHTASELADQYSIPANRVFGYRGLQQFRQRPGLGHWFSNLFMSQDICFMIFAGGIFLLFLFFLFLPSQFYDKLNITHKSDGKRRLL